MLDFRGGEGMREGRELEVTSPRNGQNYEANGSKNDETMADCLVGH